MKIVVLTGATDGIGKETAEALLNKNYTLILLARNQDKAAQVNAEWKVKYPSAVIDWIICDLFEPNSIQQATHQILQKYSVIDMLINNAGGIAFEYKVNNNGVEWTWMVNHVAPFMLTQGLLDALKKSAEARIINVSSMAHMMGHIDLKNINNSSSFSPMKAYSTAKLANIMFTYMMAEKICGTSVTINCLHPGVVGTSFAQDKGGLVGKIFKMMRPFILTPKDGAQTTIYLATSSEVTGINGKYWKKCKQAKSSSESYRKNIQQELWQHTESLIAGF
jgi:NAD(P)-dependent dehydrogenase (short-subunit alcohol dehydrogenase family)